MGNERETKDNRNSRFKQGFLLKREKKNNRGSFRGCPEPGVLFSGVADCSAG
jgi:hypothetical protein